ncbi:alpha/beta-hydrolase [Mollisia scopiformis]|uniref:Alpha/beta-hydrolase n=1 Tax=Mollisia scopiformis TaxID=149040 RepID=A0A194XG76_MOLSC|nr:alpha/beta-hydrolase [Mollisia scopiformis]KUJ18777.1 alpha/beta-hydrolase [Mollisia scopiformis]
MANIQPYTIAVSQAKIDRLHQKLALTDFPDEVENVGWDRGAPLADVKRLTEYWQEKYDWRATEAKLNELPNYTADIQAEGFETLKIHFVHQPSKVKGAIPLLFVHGWPGSFDEVVKILPELVEPKNSEHPAFHVVAPSIPGYGFSEGSRKPGFRVKQTGEICHKLMLALGYDEYVSQGGDIGCFVTRQMGKQYAQSIKASHINMPRPNPPSPHGDVELYMQHMQTPLTDKEKEGLKRWQWFTKEGSGYNLQHGTKPQTIGYSVTDSPVGLLAWIYEKLHDWTDSYPWTEDEVLTWVSIYWFSTAGPAASQRIYYEMYHDPDKPRVSSFEYIPDVLLGTANFPMELSVTPKLWNKTLGPLVLASEWDKGGHFAAYERPDAIIQDLRDMFGKKGGAYAVVKGQTGY